MSLNTLSLIFLFGICSGQNHLTRNIPSSSISIVSSSSIIGSSSGGGSGSPTDLMTPSYHRRQDEYSLAVNCSANNFIAAFSVEQPPPTIAITAPASGIGSAPSLARLTWLVRPSESYEYTVNHLPLMAFNIDDACRVATPASASASSASLLDSGDFMVLISAKSCSLIQIVLAVRRESVRARFFLLRNVADRGAGAGPVVAPQDEMGLKIPPALIAFAYAGHVGSPDKLAEELKNRSCTVSVHYRLSVLDNLINKTSVLFVSVSFILLMIISLSWLVFYYVQRFRYLHAKERLSRRLGNAAKKALTMIPVRVLKAGDKDFAWIGDQCAVCIEPYRVSDTVRILPCKHFYHRSCIDPWLLDQRTCPLCKLDILKAVGLALRDRRQRRNRSSDQFSNAGRVSAAAIFGGDSAAVASIVDVAAAAEALEEGAEDFYSMADSVGVISSSGGGGGGGIMSGCLGRGNSARPSIAAASSSNDVDSAAGVVMMTALGGGASIDRQEERGAIMLMPLSSARPDSPSVMDEATEVCYPLVHHYHHHQQQHQQQFNLRRQL